MLFLYNSIRRQSCRGGLGTVPLTLVIPSCMVDFRCVSLSSLVLYSGRWICYSIKSTKASIVWGVIGYPICLTSMVSQLLIAILYCSHNFKLFKIWGYMMLNTVHSTRVCEVGIPWCSTASHLAHVVLPPHLSCHWHAWCQGGGEVPRWISKVNKMH